MGFSPRIKKRVSDIDAQSDDNIASQSLEEGEEESVSDATPTSEVAPPTADLTEQTATESSSRSRKK